MSQSTASMRALIALVVVSLVGANASAGLKSYFYFFGDADAGPAVDGILDYHLPPPFNPADPQNQTPPDTRMIPPLVGTQFIRENADNNTGRIYGSALVGLWAPAVPTVQDSQLLVELMAYPASPLPIALEGEVLASTVVPIIDGNITPPDVESWLPPDPTDPEGSINHTSGQAVAYLVPYLFQAPYVIVMNNEDGGPLDLEVDPDARIGVRLTVEAGPNGTLPIGLVPQPIEYGLQIFPSFLLVNWYEEDPESTAPPPVVTNKPTATSKPSTSAPPTSTTQVPDEDSPAPALLVPLALVVAVILARRRLA